MHLHCHRYVYSVWVREVVVPYIFYISVTISKMTSCSVCLPYDKEAETIDEFITRFTIQCSELLHKVRNDDSKQVALLMKALPVAVFTDVQRELAPTSALNASFEQVKDALVQLYSTKRSVLGASVQFFNCKQKPGQTVEEFARDVKHFSQQCGFQAQVSLSRIQRDVFLSGLSSAPVVTSILQISEDIGFEQAVTKAKLFTQLRKDTSMLHHPALHMENDTSIKEVHSTAVVASSYVCIRCGQHGKHKAQNCFALHLKCNSCSKVGHISKVCRSKNNKPTPRNAEKKYRSNVQHCDDENGSVYGVDEVLCHMIGQTNGAGANQRRGYKQHELNLSNRHVSTNHGAVTTEIQADAPFQTPSSRGQRIRSSHTAAANTGVVSNSTDSGDDIDHFLF